MFWFAKLRLNSCLKWNVVFSQGLQQFLSFCAGNKCIFQRLQCNMGPNCNSQLAVDLEFSTGAKRSNSNKSNGKGRTYYEERTKLMRPVWNLPLEVMLLAFFCSNHRLGWLLVIVWKSELTSKDGITQQKSKTVVSVIPCHIQWPPPKRFLKQKTCSL